MVKVLKIKFSNLDGEEEGARIVTIKDNSIVLHIYTFDGSERESFDPKKLESCFIANKIK